MVYGTTGAGYSCSRPQGRLLSSDLDGVLKGWHGPPKPCFDPPCLISSFRFRTTFAIYATWRFDTLVPRSLVRSGPVFPFWFVPSRLLREMSKDVGQGSSFNRVPSWDGRPETFFHYITEIKWHLAGTKSSERPYAAARLVRRILESDYPSLKSLAYKLDPADFTTEDAVTRLISFLEASPMNRQPIPDAGRQLSAYYRQEATGNHSSVFG